MDGVIRHWPGHGRTRGEQVAGLPAGAIRQVGYGSAFTLAKLGVLTHEEWLAEVANLLVQQHGAEAARAIPPWDDDPGTLDPGMIAVLRRVQAGGTPIALLTNNTTALRRDLDRHHISDLFVTVVNSAEVEVAKPSPLIYRIAHDIMNARANEIVFVDDKMTNVLTARFVGMRAARFTGIDAFAELVVAMGIPLSEVSAATMPSTSHGRAE
jgi:putative hydrolase of the HAD superfamily